MTPTESSSYSTRDTPSDPNPEHDSPIELHTPMSLDPTALPQVITSPHAIEIQGITLWSATPIHILSIENDYHPLQINSQANLGPAFSQGWAKLPDELKLQILNSLVISPDPIEMPHYDHVAPDDATSCVYYQLLFSTPEIATLARTIYYERNTFHLTQSGSSVHLPALEEDECCFPYPGVANNHLIKDVVFQVRMYEMPSSYLDELARGTYGFQNVQHLTISIDVKMSYLDSQDSVDEIFADNATLDLEFACKGKIVLCDAGDVDGALLKQVQDLFEKKIRFGCGREKHGVVPVGF